MGSRPSTSPTRWLPAGLAFGPIPDEAMPERFATDIRPQLRPGAAIAFASGYVLAYGLIEVPDFVDVLMLAPRTLGEEVLPLLPRRLGLLRIRVR